jgi:hypothetical protein
MAEAPDVYEFPLKLRVPKGAFILVSPPPATVTQRTVEQHFGITPRAFKKLVREGAFAAKRIGQLIVVAYDDVHRALTEGAQVHARAQPVSQQTEGTVRDEGMSVAAARAYLASATTAAEHRARKKEILDISGELSSRFAEKLEDGTPNPEFDKARFNHGIDLAIATAGPFRRPERDMTATTPEAGKGYHGKCCWCDRPAYATKQTWEGDYWCGGPVCEVHARNRAANERVVLDRTILLPARDPTVPTGYDAPRRRRRKVPDRKS